MENYELYENSTSAAIKAAEALPLTDTMSETSFIISRILAIIILILIITLIYFIIKKIFFPRRCPHCYSRIHKKAIFCKHCRKDI